MTDTNSYENLMGTVFEIKKLNKQFLRINRNVIRDFPNFPENLRQWAEIDDLCGAENETPLYLDFCIEDASPNHTCQVLALKEQVDHGLEGPEL